ncbi:MAG: hypothetical protein ABI114_08455 [Rhodanobacter sp.]
MDGQTKLADGGSFSPMDTYIPIRFDPAHETKNTAAILGGK